MSRQILLYTFAAVARVSTDEERVDNARRHTAARRAIHPEPPAVQS